MVQNITIVTTADQYKVVYDLSIGAIFNDLERPQPRFQDQANTWRWIWHKRAIFRPYTMDN